MRRVITIRAGAIHIHHRPRTGWGPNSGRNHPTDSRNAVMSTAPTIKAKVTEAKMLPARAEDLRSGQAAEQRAADPAGAEVQRQVDDHEQERPPPPAPVPETTARRSRCRRSS